MTIRSYLEKCAAERPNGKALQYFEGKQCVSRTWAQFLDGVKRVGSGYGECFKIEPAATRAAIILPNCPEWMEVYLGLAGAGVSVIPVDPKLHNEEVKYILRDAGVSIVTTDREHLEMMRAIVPEVAEMAAVILIDTKGDESFDTIGPVPIYGYKALKSYARTAEWYDSHVCSEKDVASIIYTSGTTGKPKGAMLTHGNFTADAEGALAAFEGMATSKDSFCVILPLFHAFSFCTNFVVPIVIGARMAFVRSLYTIGDDIKTLKPSIVMSVPLLAEKIFDKVDAAIKKSAKAKWLMKLGLGCLVARGVRKGLGGKIRFMVVGGAPCPKHVLEGWKALGVPVLEGYGLTECSPVVSISNVKRSRIGTIGEKLRNIEVRLADVNENGVGELQIKGPITMKGYWCNDEATKETFDGEWLKTGDLASMDADGHITIRGRKKALIVNREGKNIYPEEVENAIAVDQIVADCVVVGYTTGGIPGEKVGCVVHPNEDILKAQNDGKPMEWPAMEKIAIEHIHRCCAELADYKRVRKIVISHEPLERTSVQKVRRVAYKGKLDE